MMHLMSVIINGISVFVAVILGFLNVEKENRKWDEEHAKEV